MNPKEALIAFHVAHDVATVSYANFWKSMLEQYGFTEVRKPVTGRNYVGGFVMEWQGRLLECYCLPSHYQGMKITWRDSYGIAYWKKVASMSGLRKFLRFHQLGKPI